MAGAEIPADVARIEAQLLAPGAPFELEEVEVAGRRMQVFKGRPRTLRDLLVKSIGFGDAPYVVASGQSATPSTRASSARSRLLCAIATAFVPAIAWPSSPRTVPSGSSASGRRRVSAPSQSD
jgi:hypothetical protein